jgi:predicted nuclease of predicted toxin-antitoxin system
MQDNKIIFLADECVFFNTVKLMREKNLEVISIQELNLTGIKDSEVLNKAQELDAILITNDKDFTDIYESPPSI